MTLPLHGLCAFPITPANEHGTINAAAYRALVARLAQAKVDSIGLLGSTGGYMYFEPGERKRGLDVAMEEISGALPAIVSVGALRTDIAIDLARHARSAGAIAGLLAPVSYAPLSEGEVFEHYAAVAGESGLPIIIYDNPGTTHFEMSPAFIDRLAAIEGVVAIKNAAGETHEALAQLSRQRRALPAGFAIGYSGDKRSIEPLIAGADTWYSVIGGTLPSVGLAMTRAAQGGNADQARRLSGELAPVWNLFKKYSSMRVVYAIAEALGYETGTPPRPILPLSEAAKEEVASALRALGELAA
ncbi:dihydrodipicolinate synthase family protein [Devosia yakushimensis]|uniref:Dihydrodipicolinate synthase family protein n=1 Tax=Devosia yakushimensis TaxID=470028 RepID=A0ABQ5UKF8_9HYPH|nr:dihydrodipicolinate synthase family protein [Devosia yakushimensis]GLQ12119.1 dihydrodipicolinate synthase family protein [Devosia yakushimensis]